MSEIIIGIDLGTTNSEVAVVQDGQLTVIKDQGSALLPSFVGLSDNNEILVGETAKNQYAAYPERTIKSIKRSMGEDVQVVMGEQSYTPQEISAVILKRLKAIAEQHLGHSVTKAVITVPAYFSDTQRQATREAGDIAGLEVVRMINEPTAAALSYESDQKTHRRVMVYDLGGGTFDVSVVNIENDVVEVISSHGNNHLGGDDFDQKIIDFLVDHLKEKQGIDVESSSKTMARLVRAAEIAKRTLSDQPFAHIEEEYIAEKDGQPIHLSIELDRKNFEAMIEDYIEDTLESVHIALSDAQLTASDIDKILLVGGSTRVPLVRECLQKKFGMEPHSEVHPDLCVAMGAAIQAAMIGGAKVSTVLVDVTPYTYGTSAIGHINGEYTPFMYCPIIHKNTPLPVSKSEVFATSSDGQEVAEINIYQGEDPDALNNIEIGKFTVEGLKDVEAGNRIVISLNLDLNGVLNVSAKEKDTGLEKTITIENVISRFEEAQLDTARDRIDAFFAINADEDASDIAPTGKDEHHEARSLIEKAQGMLEKANNEDREDMVNIIEALNAAIEAEDTQKIAENVEQLSDILYYLEN